MTQSSRTTETINRDNAAIRDIMHRIRELTVPDRATLALGLIGHLATMMNRSQMSKLMQQLQEEAERVQDVPPSRQRDDDPSAVERTDDRSVASSRSHAAAGTSRSQSSSRTADYGDRDVRAGSGDREEQARSGESDARKDARVAEAARPAEPRKRHGDVLEHQVVEAGESRKDGRGSSVSPAESRQGVGQAGRGEFRSGRLL
jgi:hypothetical protein